MSDQATEQSVEDRMASFFAADAGVPAESPEVATAPEASASDEAAPVEESPDVAQEQAADDADSGYEEVELDGETFRVPPKLKDAVLRQADYTRKTQEVAETARQLQAQQQQLQIQAEFQRQAAPEMQQLQQLESQLAQYRQLDWAQMDMETLTKTKFAMDSIKERADSLRGTLGAKHQQFQQAIQQQRQKQLEDGLKYLRTSIPGFDSETVRNLRNFAVNEGFSEPEVDSIADPRFVRLMWKAQQYDRLKSSTKSAVDAVKKAPPVIKPGASQGQGAVQKNRYVQARQQLKKSGSLDDAARLFEGLFRK